MSGKPRTPLRVTLDRFERDDAGRRLGVLVFDDGQQLVIDAERLPAGSTRGQVLILSLMPDEQETRTRADYTTDLQRRLFGD